MGYTSLKTAWKDVARGLATWLVYEAVAQYIAEEELRRRASAKHGHESNEATKGLSYEWHGAPSDGYQVMQANAGTGSPHAVPHRAGERPDVRLRVISQHGITCLWPDREVA